MKRIAEMILLGTALAAMAGVAGAQERPAVTAQANTIYVGADGKYEAAPDTALIQFNISAQESSSRDAYDRASRNAQQIRDLLKANGVDAKEAQIGFFQLTPVYDYTKAKRKLTGYQVNASVTLKLRDFAKVGPITQALADADITDSQNLSYTLESMDAAKQKAIEDAYAKARASADTVARASGRPLGELIYASVDTFEQVRVVPMMAMAKMAPGAAQMEAAPTQDFTPQTTTVTAHVNAMFGLK